MRSLALAIASVALLLLLLEGTFRVVGFDFADPSRALARVPVYFRVPTEPVTPGIFRRPGPEVWEGNVILQELERQGAVDDFAAYAPAPSVRVAYGDDGFREPEPLDDWEVVVVGDSFVELGYLPDEALHTSLLALELGVRVRNLGVSQVGPLSYVAYLEHYGLAPSTRDAVLVFYEGNDLTELVLERDRMRAAERAEDPMANRLDRPPQTSLLRAVAGALRGLSRGGAPTSFANATYRAPDGTRVPVTVYNTPPSGRGLAPGTQALLASALTRFGELAAAHGARAWVLYVPCKLRILHGRVALAPTLPARFHGWSPTDLPAVVEALSTRVGLRFLDAAGCLRDEIDAGRLPYNTVFDAHLNARGSACVARTLAEGIGPGYVRP